MEEIKKAIKEDVFFNSKDDELRKAILEKIEEE